MTEEYDYTKTGVDKSGLLTDIKYSKISKTLELIRYDGTNLEIYFDEALTSGEQTILDNIVANNTGSKSANWRVLCATCGIHTTGEYSDTPATCRVCDGKSISDAVQQDPYQIMESPDGSKWGHFQADDSTIIAAKMDGSK
jgi:hypothetical protein